MKRYKKILVTLFVLVYTSTLIPLPGRVVFAEEPVEEPVVEETDEEGEVQVGPSPSPTPEPTQSPEPSPSPSPEPCCEGQEVTNDNEASVENEVTAITNTGENVVVDETPETSEATASAEIEIIEEEGQESESDSQSGEGSANTIETGDAVTNVEVTNTVNTNINNSDVSVAVQNIYVDDNGDIDLTRTDVSGISFSNSPVTNDSEALVVNLIYAGANTGANEIYGTGGIATGNAYASVNLMNFINSNFINSTWQIVIINIFGSLSGNILLPEPGSVAETSLGEDQDEGLVVTSDNEVLVNNESNAGANSGDNSVEGEGLIGTGGAAAVNNVQTIANTNLLGAAWYYLTINNIGIWNGQFLGWGAEGEQDPALGQMVFNYGELELGGSGGNQDCLCAGEADNNNLANVDNQVYVSANTGGNYVYGSGQVFTGNAFSAVNILNLINTNVVNSSGFFGIINIFGSFTGDIGGASLFVQEEEVDEVEEVSVESEEGDEVYGEGGNLTVSLSNNVGTYVNPGDTVTFFIKATNIGTGPVYESRVNFNLYDSNGEIAAVQTFDLGKFDVGKVADISFGLVLAETAPNGYYSAKVQVTGKVGPFKDDIDAQSDTKFLVGFGLGRIDVPDIIGDVEGATDSQDNGYGAGVGTNIAGGSAVNYFQLAFWFLGGLGMLYIAHRSLRRTYFYLLEVNRSKGKMIKVSRLLASKISQKAMAIRSLIF